MNIEDTLSRVRAYLDRTGDCVSVDALVANLEAGGMASNCFGSLWERTLIEELRGKGHDVLDVTKKLLKHDLEVDGHRVQCKYLGGNNRSIIPSQRDEDGIRLYRRGDFDVLAVAIESTDNRYFIPAERVTRPDGFIFSTFKPHLTQWQDRWDVFNGPGRAKEQGLLFEL